MLATKSNGTSATPAARPPALLAQAFLALGHYGEAVQFAEEALRRAPGDPIALEVRDAARRSLES